jgi:hypothetical protein
MNAHPHQSANYALPSGTRVERERRREEWDECQQRAGMCLQFRHLNLKSHSGEARKISMSDVHIDPSRQSPVTLRRRADSHQPATTRPQARQSVDASHDEYHQSSATSAHSDSTQSNNEPTRGSSTDNGYAGNALPPQLSSSNPHGEVRGLSCNFNAPTHVELERTREHRKSLPSVEKMRSKVKGWVRA